MKIRLSIILFCIMAFLAIFLIIWFGNKPAESFLQSTVETSITQTNISAKINSMPIHQPTMTNTMGATASTNSPKVLPIGKNKVEILKTILLANDADIVFYGRLQDQFGNAIGNANVNFSVRYENLSGSGVKRGQVMADGNGFFTISGYKGQDISVVPEKSGYVPLSMEGSGNYSPALYPENQRAHPDQNNPVVIKMWKLQGAEHLIHYQTQAHVPIDGSSVTFNLQTGEQVKSGGDITISVESTPKPNIRQRYNWQVKIQAVGGGLISSEGDFEKMFAAPDSGYDPEFDTTYQKDTKPWTTTFNAAFYFSSRNGGCYGKIGIEILSDIVKNGTVPVILNSYVNPASSRNLEIDSAKTTEAHP